MDDKSKANSKFTNRKIFIGRWKLIEQKIGTTRGKALSIQIVVRVKLLLADRYINWRSFTYSLYLERVVSIWSHFSEVAISNRLDK